MTNETKHARGPWTVGKFINSDNAGVFRAVYSKHAQGYLAVVREGDVPQGYIAKIYCGDAVFDKQKREMIDANARLIALAPELLEALDTLTGTTCCDCVTLREGGDCHTIHCAVYHFKQLIARAKGGND